MCSFMMIGVTAEQINSADEERKEEYGEEEYGEEEYGDAFDRYGEMNPSLFEGDILPSIGSRWEIKGEID